MPSWDSTAPTAATISRSGAGSSSSGGSGSGGPSVGGGSRPASRARRGVGAGAGGGGGGRGGGGGGTGPWPGADQQGALVGVQLAEVGGALQQPPPVQAAAGLAQRVAEQSHRPLHGVRAVVVAQVH